MIRNKRKSSYKTIQNDLYCSQILIRINLQLIVQFEDLIKNYDLNMFIIVEELH